MDLSAFLFIFLLMVIGVYCFLQFNRRHSKKHTLHKDYLAGLNFLLNEQPDKAADIFTDLFEVNKDTVETYLALGNFFRKRGEISKATRIHQNLVTHTQLPKKIRIEALSALGEDYLKAGVLDRAERIFQEVLSLDPEAQSALSNLLEIYQQEKAWHEAIAVAEKLLPLNNEKNYKKIIAQYNCEVAEAYFSSGDSENAELFLKRALKINDQCARALKVELKSFSSYRCDHCGYISKRFSWLCPSCKNWEEICPYEKV
ncbi:MAG: tetratricopeptide repeat protein [Gammaproteobacteria bacterium]|nr:tetratricopeptide repeat protein [Gammaproteobacteria bacterium]